MSSPTKAPARPLVQAASDAQPLTLAEMVAEAEASLTAAQTVAAKAASDVEQLTSELGSAREAYFASPDDEKASQAAIDLAHKLDLAQHRVRASAAKVETAASRLASARSTLAASDLESKKAALRKAAAPATLQAATAPYWETFFATSSHAALDAIEDAYAASVAASTELDKLGEHTPSLSGWHAFLPWLEREAGAGRTFRMGLEREPAPETALAFLMIRNHSIAMPAEHCAALLDRVSILRGGARTMRDVERIDLERSGVNTQIPVSYQGSVPRPLSDRIVFSNGSGEASTVRRSQ